MLRLENSLKHNDAAFVTVDTEDIITAELISANGNIGLEMQEFAHRVAPSL